MSKEELLKPRYKCIGSKNRHYPGSAFKVDDILTQCDDDFRFYQKDGNSAREPDCPFYPHLFKKLEWWQERNVDEFPMYLKVVGDVFSSPELDFIKDGTIIRVKSWDVNLPYVSKTSYVNVSHTIPATEQEYNEFINPKKQ